MKMNILTDEQFNEVFEMNEETYMQAYKYMNSLSENKVEQFSFHANCNWFTCVINTVKYGDLEIMMLNEKKYQKLLRDVLDNLDKHIDTSKDIIADECESWDETISKEVMLNELKLKGVSCSDLYENCGFALTFDVSKYYMGHNITVSFNKKAKAVETYLE